MLRVDADCEIGLTERHSGEPIEVDDQTRFRGAEARTGRHTAAQSIGRQERFEGDRGDGPASFSAARTEI
jgi:hypothetical protein